MDDLKIYTAKKTQLEKVMKEVTVVMKSIRLSLGMDKCAMDNRLVKRNNENMDIQFYGRYQDLIEKYQRSVNVMVNDSFPG